MSDLLGKPPFTSDRMYEDGTPPGVVMGLAYTAMGGSALYIETVGIRSEDKKKKPKGSDVSLNLTGQLGEVMTESSNIAMTVARRKLQKWDSSSDFYENNKIHNEWKILCTKRTQLPKNSCNLEYLKKNKQTQNIY